MIPLSTIKLKHLRQPTIELANLQHHRTFILEPFRDIYFRNRSHFTSASARIQIPRPSSDAPPSTHATWFQSVVDQMILDNDRALDDEIRSIVQFSIISMTRLYYILLSAELHYLSQTSKRHRLLKDDLLLDVLVHNSKSIQELYQFRHALLHPEQHLDDQDRPFVPSEIFQANTLPQLTLDDAISRIRTNIGDQVQELLAGLPHREWLMVISSFIHRCITDPFCVMDDALANLEQLQNSVIEGIGQLSDIDREWTPTELEHQKAGILVDYMRRVEPVGPFATNTGDTSVHVPLDMHLPPDARTFRQLDHHTRITDFHRTSDAASRFMRHHIGYLQILGMVATLREEIRYLMNATNIAAETIFSYREEEKINEISQLSIETTIKICGLGDVSLALLWPFLTAYEEICRNNPSFVISKLENIRQNHKIMDKLRTHRNAVFHVQNRSFGMGQLGIDLGEFFTNDPDPLHSLIDGSTELYWTILEQEGEI